MKNELLHIKSSNILDDTRKIIEFSRSNAVKSVDFCRVQMYWSLGRRIFEEEQQKKERADYGSYLIKKLAEKLESEYGSGFNKRQLERARQFYCLYPIATTLRSQLYWSQYRRLIQISDPDKREYYELESVNNGWTAREKAEYYEKDFESAIISHITDFLLEMGKGFSFVARQKRILIEDDEFFIDMVFYNRLLKCFVIVEIKTGKLTHQDLGQLQMYVNFYDRNEKLTEENKTIGILLCALKNDTVVKMSLPEDNSTIHASEYNFYMPTTEQLIKEINEVKQLVDK